MMRRLLLAAAFAAAATTAQVPAACAQGTLTVAMTAGDLPITMGTPDQGFEGYRFVAFSLYDSLTGWDLSRSDKAAELVPALAESWAIDPANPKRWIFKLRQGVKWHDGCAFTADDVVWNFGRVLDKDAPRASPRSTTTPSPSPPRISTACSPIRSAWCR